MGDSVWSSEPLVPPTTLAFRESKGKTLFERTSFHTYIVCRIYITISLDVFETGVGDVPLHSSLFSFLNIKVTTCRFRSGRRTVVSDFFVYVVLRWVRNWLRKERLKIMSYRVELFPNGCFLFLHIFSFLLNLTFGHVFLRGFGLSDSWAQGSGRTYLWLGGGVT